MKTWQQLADLAQSDRLELHRSHGGVTVYTTGALTFSLVSIWPGALDGEDMDVVLRAATEAALQALKGLER